MGRNRAQLAPGQGLACCRQAGSIGCGIIVFLYLVTAPWSMELGPGPLVGRIMPRSMSRGGCGLRKSLGSPSAEGWGLFLPSSFLGLRHPYTGANEQLGGARS